MQLRRFVLAVLALAALAAILWFVRRDDARRAGELGAPIAQSPSRPEVPASVLETPPVQQGRASAGAATDATTDSGASASASAPNAPAEFDGLTVRVLTPSGQPFPGARISFVAAGNGPITVGMPQPTDATGCWHCRIHPGEALDLRAFDPSGPYAPAYAFDVGPETRSLEMKLEATSSHALVVVDEQNAPIERFAWRVLDERQYTSHRSGQRQVDEDGRLRDTRLEQPGTGSFTPTAKDTLDHPGGRIELRVGSLAFAVQVEAEDFEQAQAGPFATSDAPSEIRVVLHRLPGIRGRVVHAGKGVSGAWVKLLQPSLNSRVMYVNGFASRSQPWAVAESKTGEDGGFLLQLRRTGQYLVRAGADGLALAEIGPRRFEAHQGADGLELELSATGTIEGRLLFADDEPNRDWILGASRGDGLARSVHTDAQGRFLFEELTPGEWTLQPVGEDLNPGEVRVISDGGELDRPTPATCVVRAGESTRVEFDLRRKAVLSGSCSLPGWSNADGSGSLTALGGALSRVARFEWSPTAGLHAAADQPGEYRLRLSWSGEKNGCTLGLQEDLRLEAGENTWTLARPVGELVLVNPLDTEQWALLRCDLDPKRRASLGVKLTAHAERRVRGLPIGTWVLLNQDHGGVQETVEVAVTATGAAGIEVR